MTTTIRGPPITFTSIQAVVWPISIMIELSSKITMFLHFFGEYISSSSMYYTSRGTAKIWNLDKCVNRLFRMEQRSEKVKHQRLYSHLLRIFCICGPLWSSKPNFIQFASSLNIALCWEYHRII